MVFDLERLVRDNIRTLTPYSSARAEWSGDGMTLLDANENAFVAPHNRYPDPRQTKLKRRLSEITGVPVSRMFIGNGSDEAIDLLFRITCRPGIDNVVICPPTYGMYEVAAAINDVEVRCANLSAHFLLDVDRTLAVCDENTKMVFVCSPNNPTGNSVGRNRITDLASKLHAIVVLDEAYIHFSDDASLAAELGPYPNLVVLQTLSKAWGMAALRIGLAFAREDIIALFNKVKPPYNLSSEAQEIALATLENEDTLRQTIERAIEQRRRLEVDLRRRSFIERVYPSDANFLLVRCKEPRTVYDHLRSRGIIVRDRSGVALCEGCLRITVGTAEENDRLLEALEIYEKSFVY